ncbi:hypothetical protein IC006_0695 [Sulfuracidifex tepidarius]|uniref:Cytochrome oxidase subunit I profile domain-containing protein n=1 Tax=Sulfuracidifex tepidarius TaxID=1294262 RepID=A0A510DTA5_9CREN|nr:hypothetical protein IC006_0695 [Sulfuracidifex tepidarius]
MRPVRLKEIDPRVLYFLGGISWLGITGVGAMNLRTYLLNEGSENFDGVYYFMLTLHGDSGMIAFVEFSAIALILYLNKIEGRKTIMNVTFLTSNLGLLIFFLGGPITGWYMLYPLSVQPISFIGIYQDYWISYVGLLIESFSMEICSLYLFTKAKGFSRIPAALMTFSIPFLALVSLLYILASNGYSFPPLIVDTLFWEYGSPATYFLTYSIIALLYSSMRSYSERWRKWTVIPLAVLPFMIFANHLQTWPIPDWVRELSDFSTMFLTGFLGITFLNMVIPITTERGRSIKDFLNKVTLLGFAVSSAPSVILPFSFFDPEVHDTYFVVGSFHSIVWDFLVLGFLACFASFVSDRVEIGKGETLVKVGALTWLGSSTLLSYVMMAAGLYGLIRREIHFPLVFIPYMDLMSWLAFIALSGISLAFSVLLIRLASSSKMKLDSPTKRIENFLTILKRK